MVIGKIKPTATIVAQFAAGVEIDAIQHEGKMFLPVVGMGEFASHEPAPEKPSKTTEKEAPKKSAPKEVEETEESAKTTYTEEELMEMDSKVLVKLLKDEYGIDPADHPGKNTNKKLRDLILNAQENEGEESEEEETEEETEETSEESIADKVADLLEDFDAGKKNRKKTIAAIVALADDADEDKIGELLTEFEDDADADIDEMAKTIADVLEGKSKKAKKTEKKSAKKSKKEEDLVEVEDLEVGDRVSVWWDDDNQDWYDGEVKSIKKGKVVIAYDDDTEDAIDPEVHTKIKRLAD